MTSFKRLQHIIKIVTNSYPDLTVSNASTLVMNYLEASDLQNINFPNINYASKFKRQIVVANKIGLETSFAADKSFEIVIVSTSKSREESFAQIAVGYKRTKPGGLLIIEGSKSNGIDTIIQKLSDFQAIDSITAKSHGKIAMLKVSFEKATTYAKWLDFDTPSKNEDGFYSLPGLFSYKRADPASKFLTTMFDGRLGGDVIDLGAGWGFLSAKLLDRSSQLKSITLIDHDQRALNCAKENIKSPKVIFKWRDITEMTEFSSKFDTVICNPPFHSANGISIELGKSFIKAAHKTLKSAGSLLLVSNIQLPYENLISRLFEEFSIPARNKYFKIILAKRPKKYYNTSPDWV